MDKTTELKEIAPAEGSRNGWCYSSYLRIGRAKIPNRKRGGFEHYGVYGVRRTATGWELYTQWEGQEDPDGRVTGRTLLASSMDAGAYIWSPEEWFVDVVLF